MSVVDVFLYFLILMVGAYLILYPISKFIASKRLKKLKRGGRPPEKEVDEISRSRMQSVLSKQQPKVIRNQKAGDVVIGNAEVKSAAVADSTKDSAPEPDRVDKAIQDAMRDYQARRAAKPNDPVLHPEKDLEGRFDLLRSQYGKKAVIAFRPYPPRPRVGGRSRLGGKPDLPRSVEWPRAPGYPGGANAKTALHFLLQIDLRAFPKAVFYYSSAGSMKR